MTRTAFAFALLALFPAPGSAQGWPSWRGPSGNNVAPADASPPIEWSEDQNVRWKVAIPGDGASTPVVHKGRIYLTSAVDTGRDDAPTAANDAKGPTRIYEFVVLAIDRHSGKELWRKTVLEAVPHENGHKTGSHASASPIIDGDRLYAFFGSRGLHCLDLAGEITWSKQLGLMNTLRGFGEGATPVIHGDTIVVQWDHEGPSFIVAFDKRTGKERWRQPRETDSTWSSPAVAVVDGRAQVIASGSKVTWAYDLQTGKPIWHCGGFSANPVTSPIVVDGLVYVMNSYEGDVIQAIRLAGAKGDLTDSKHLVWSGKQKAPFVPNALVHDGLLYYLRGGGGVLNCADALTGEAIYSGKRLGMRTIHSSPVLADGRIYVTSRDGKTAVVAAGREFRKLAMNSLDDTVDATLVPVGKDLFIRGRKHLYCITAEGSHRR